MSDWKSTLKADPIDWLLEKDNLSVRYFTLTDILDKPENAPEVKEAKREIMKSGVAPSILAKQTVQGYWGIAQDFYIRAKYKGTVWQLITLAELGRMATMNASRRPASSFSGTPKSVRVEAFLPMEPNLTAVLIAE